MERQRTHCQKAYFWLKDPRWEPVIVDHRTIVGVGGNAHPLLLLRVTSQKAQLKLLGLLALPSRVRSLNPQASGPSPSGVLERIADVVQGLCEGKELPEAVPPPERSSLRMEGTPCK